MSKRLFNETRFTTAEMLVAATVLSVALLLAPSMASAADLVSINIAGKSGNAESLAPLITPDGRFVVFASEASDLVATEDKNEAKDVFMRDRQTGTTTLVSVNSDGNASGNGLSGSPVITVISADGQIIDGPFVAFVSKASDLVKPETNGNNQIFVRNLTTGVTTLVSINSAGTAGGDMDSDSPVISADGKFVAFQSSANDLVAKDNPRGSAFLDSDVFVRDLQAGTTTLVSVSGTDSANGRSHFPVISADGLSVAFVSNARNLVEPETNGNNQIFVRDLQSGITTLVSVNSDGTQGDGDSISPVISADGLSVAFVSFASNLVATDSNKRPDIFVRAGGTTTLVSVNTSGGDSGNGFSGEPVISPDGQSVAFSSSSDKLVAQDTNRNRDVFVRDLQAMPPTTTLVSVNNAGDASGNRRSDSPVISADGRVVAFRSSANDLVATDTNRATDVFVRDLQNETTTLVSVNISGADSGKGNSQFPAISADGTVVAFLSSASDLVGTDNNGVADVFVSVLDQEAPAVVLIIDEDSIDNGNFFAAADINDYIAQIGLRTQLPFFAANVGKTITLHTGQMGDEGWFALKTIPASWGPTNDDGLRNFVGQPSQPFPHNIGEGLGRGSYPEALLDKIPNVTPLRADGLERLKGEQVCAVVYDTDISINYAPLNGSLRGATLGTVAFQVMSVTELTGFSSSSLPQVEIKILDAENVCKGQLTVF